MLPSNQSPQSQSQSNKLNRYGLEHQLKQTETNKREVGLPQIPSLVYQYMQSFQENDKNNENATMNTLIYHYLCDLENSGRKPEGQKIKKNVSLVLPVNVRQNMPKTTEQFNQERKKQKFSNQPNKNVSYNPIILNMKPSKEEQNLKRQNLQQMTVEGESLRPNNKDKVAFDIPNQTVAFCIKNKKSKPERNLFERRDGKRKRSKTPMDQIVETDEPNISNDVKLTSQSNTNIPRKSGSPFNSFYTLLPRNGLRARKHSLAAKGRMGNNVTDETIFPLIPFNSDSMILRNDSISQRHLAMEKGGRENVPKNRNIKQSKVKPLPLPIQHSNYNPPRNEIELQLRVQKHPQILRADQTSRDTKLLFDISSEPTLTPSNQLQKEMPFTPITSYYAIVPDNGNKAAVQRPALFKTQKPLTVNVQSQQASYNIFDPVDSNTSVSSSKLIADQKVKNNYSINNSYFAVIPDTPERFPRAEGGQSGIQSHKSQRDASKTNKHKKKGNRLEGRNGNAGQGEAQNYQHSSGNQWLENVKDQKNNAKKGVEFQGQNQIVLNARNYQSNDLFLSNPVPIHFTMNNSYFATIPNLTVSKETKGEQEVESHSTHTHHKSNTRNTERKPKEIKQAHMNENNKSSQHYDDTSHLSPIQVDERNKQFRHTPQGAVNVNQNQYEFTKPNHMPTVLNATVRQNQLIDVRQIPNTLVMNTSYYATIPEISSPRATNNSTGIGIQPQKMQFNINAKTPAVHSKAGQQARYQKKLPKREESRNFQSGNEVHLYHEQQSGNANRLTSRKQETYHPNPENKSLREQSMQKIQITNQIKQNQIKTTNPSSVRHMSQDPELLHDLEHIIHERGRFDSFDSDFENQSGMTNNRTSPTPHSHSTKVNMIDDQHHRLYKQTPNELSENQYKLAHINKNKFDVSRSIAQMSHTVPKDSFLVGRDLSTNYDDRSPLEMYEENHSQSVYDLQNVVVESNSGEEDNELQLSELNLNDTSQVVNVMSQAQAQWDRRLFREEELEEDETDNGCMNTIVSEFTGFHRSTKTPVPKDPETFPDSHKKSSRRAEAESLSQHGSGHYANRPREKKNQKKKEKRRDYQPNRKPKVLSGKNVQFPAEMQPRESESSIEMKVDNLDSYDSLSVVESNRAGEGLRVNGNANNIRRIKNNGLQSTSITKNNESKNGYALVGAIKTFFKKRTTLVGPHNAADVSAGRASKRTKEVKFDVNRYEQPVENNFSDSNFTGQQRKGGKSSISPRTVENAPAKREREISTSGRNKYLQPESTTSATNKGNSPTKSRKETILMAQNIPLMYDGGLGKGYEEAHFPPEQISRQAHVITTRTRSRQSVTSSEDDSDDDDNDDDENNESMDDNDDNDDNEETNFPSNARNVQTYWQYMKKKLRRHESPPVRYEVEEDESHMTDVQKKQRVHDVLNQYSGVHILHNMKDPIPKDPENFITSDKTSSRRVLAENLSQYGSMQYEPKRRPSRFFKPKQPANSYAAIVESRGNYASNMLPHQTHDSLFAQGGSGRPTRMSPNEESGTSIQVSSNVVQDSYTDSDLQLQPNLKKSANTFNFDNAQYPRSYENEYDNQQHIHALRPVHKKLANAQNENTSTNLNFPVAENLKDKIGNNGRHYSRDLGTRNRTKPSRDNDSEMVRHYKEYCDSREDISPEYRSMYCNHVPIGIDDGTPFIFGGENIQQTNALIDTNTSETSRDSTNDGQADRSHDERTQNWQGASADTNKNERSDRTKDLQYVSNATGHTNETRKSKKRSETNLDFMSNTVTRPTKKQSENVNSNSIPDIQWDNRNEKVLHTFNVTYPPAFWRDLEKDATSLHSVTNVRDEPDIVRQGVAADGRSRYELDKDLANRQSASRARDPRTAHSSKFVSFCLPTAESAKAVDHDVSNNERCGTTLSYIVCPPDMPTSESLSDKTLNWTIVIRHGSTESNGSQGQGHTNNS